MNIFNYAKLSSNQKISLISIIISIISVVTSVCVSIYTIGLSNQANQNSIQANKIAIDSKNINRKQLDLNIDERSQRIVQEAYDNIYDDAQARIVITIMKSGSIINNPDKLLKIVDSLEEAGLSFCQGTAFVRHIKMYLKNTLSAVCFNEEVNKHYLGKKMAWLCFVQNFFLNHYLQNRLIRRIFLLVVLLIAVYLKI